MKTTTDHPSPNRRASWLRRQSLRAEAALDGAVSAIRGAPDRAVLVPYAGYAHGGGTELFARVLERPSRWRPTAEDGRLANLLGVGSLFTTSEVPCAAVRVDMPDGSRDLTADEEGYVRATLSAPLSAHMPASAMPEHTHWDDLPARPTSPPGADVSVPVLCVGSSARFAVLSDIDDTVMETGAENLARNLVTTFTSNTLTRRVYDRVPELYRAMNVHADGVVNPVFYLSSSPWNLYRMIHDVLRGAGVPWGPIFLRDYGLDETKLVASTHGDHKLTHARAVMDHLDGLPFVLIGDLGQADTSIYAQLVRERPSQVAGVVIHRPSGREYAGKLADIKQIAKMGVPVVVTRDYSEAERLARERGWIG